MDQEKVGKFIAQKRKEKGLTQARLAQALGVTDKSVSKWERGKSLPDASLYLPLCAALGISVNELFVGERLEHEQKQQAYDESILEIIKIYEKLKSFKTGFLGLFLLLLGILLAAVPEGGSHSSFALFLNGVFTGMSAGCSLFGVILAVYGVVRAGSKENGGTD
ncbi:MAG: helix-turn-helix domain-containing protein [Oscillospiraceae bacterium]|jgi:transcriptional regulator with XRE-family HTH domain|nr:helix-turn-helix domain-containing protein [Oscillospiraceae bacterium]